MRPGTSGSTTVATVKPNTSQNRPALPGSRQQQQRPMAQLPIPSKVMTPDQQTSHSSQHRQVQGIPAPLTSTNRTKDLPSLPVSATSQITAQVGSGSRIRAKEVSSKPAIASLSEGPPCSNVCARLGQPIILDTQFPFDVFKSQAFGCNLGVSSIGTASLAKTRTYERVPGKTLKAHILELMKHDHWTGVHVTKLDELYGVMVSLCTANACRKTLWQICSSGEVISYSEEDKKFASSEMKEITNEYITLAKSFPGSTFASLWVWLQEKIAEKAVSKSAESALIVTLRRLIELMAGSGYRDGGLVVWTPSVVTNAGNARLLKCKWAQFLEDTADSACFAVATPQKYIFKQGSKVLPIGTSCHECLSKTDTPRDTHPALYTQIIFSRSIEKPKRSWGTIRDALFGCRA